MKVQLESWAYPPERAHRQDAGLDIRSPEYRKIPPRESAIIDTGVHVEIPFGQVGFLKSKSGLNVKKGITSEGVIDAGYTGSIICKLYNHSDKAVEIDVGDKITQLVILPVVLDEIEIVDRISGFERGDNGFGSTGR